MKNGSVTGEYNDFINCYGIYCINYLESKITASFIIIKVYDSSQDCLKGLKGLKDKAKDDAINKCKNYCDFLSDKCEMNPPLLAKMSKLLTICATNKCRMIIRFTSE